MDFFESIGSKISQAGTSTSDKLKRLQSISQLNAQASKLEKSIAELTAKLGAAYLEAHRDDEQNEFPELVAEIVGQRAKVDGILEEIRRMKATAVCENCGAELKKGTLFCPRCGTKAPQQNETVQGVNVCGQCGREVSEGAAFCTGCGTPVRKQADAGASAIRQSEPVDLCPGCGKRLRQGARFCAACGRRIY